MTCISGNSRKSEVPQKVSLSQSLVWNQTCHMWTEKRFSTKTMLAPSSRNMDIRWPSNSVISVSGQWKQCVRVSMWMCTWMCMCVLYVHVCACVCGLCVCICVCVCGVCVCICVYTCVCVCRCNCLHTNVWIPEVNAQCLPLSLSILLFKTSLFLNLKLISSARLLAGDF